jgi:acyl phosphate:glycerol-3-phosphate acyltransferase
LVVLVVDVLKGAGAIIVARSFSPWLYTELSPTPPTALDLQIWVHGLFAWPELPCCLGIAARFD